MLAVHEMYWSETELKSTLQTGRKLYFVLHINLPQLTLAMYTNMFISSLQKNLNNLESSLESSPVIDNL